MVSVVAFSAVAYKGGKIIKFCPHLNDHHNLKFVWLITMIY